jgi:hypothetical protein
MRQFRLSGSVEGVMGNHDSYSDLDCSAHELYRSFALSSSPADRAGSVLRHLGLCLQPIVKIVPILSPALCVQFI